MQLAASRAVRRVRSLLAGTTCGGGAIGCPNRVSAGCLSWWRGNAKGLGLAQLAASRAVRSLLAGTAGAAVGALLAVQTGLGRLSVIGGGRYAKGLGLAYCNTSTICTSLRPSQLSA